MSTKKGSAKKAKSKQAENGANEGMSMNLLDELESQVKAAAERIRSLNEENRRLSTRVETLEEELEEARKAADGEDGEDALAEERAAWAEERAEVRRRLEGLTRTLEDLLADEEDDEDDEDDGDSEDEDDEDDGSEEE